MDRARDEARAIEAQRANFERDVEKLAADQKKLRRQQAEASAMMESAQKVQASAEVKIEGLNLYFDQKIFAKDGALYPHAGLAGEPFAKLQSVKQWLIEKIELIDRRNGESVRAKLVAATTAMVAALRGWAIGSLLGVTYDKLTGKPVFDLLHDPATPELPATIEPFAYEIASVVSLLPDRSHIWDIVGMAREIGPTLDGEIARNAAALVAAHTKLQQSSRDGR